MCVRGERVRAPLTWRVVGSVEPLRDLGPRGARGDDDGRALQVGEGREPRAPGVPIPVPEASVCVWWGVWVCV